MTRHAHAFENTRWICGRSYRTGSSMEHRPVCCTATAEMMPLHKTRKPTTFAGTDDVNQFVGVENVDHHFVAGIGAFFAFDSDFTHKACRCHIRLFEMARHCLIDALRLDKLDESKLHGIVAVRLLRLFL